MDYIQIKLRGQNGSQGYLLQAVGAIHIKVMQKYHEQSWNN